MFNAYYVIVDPRNAELLWYKIDINAKGRYPHDGGAIICFNTEQEAKDYIRFYDGDVGLDSFILRGTPKLMLLDDIIAKSKGSVASTVNLYTYLDFELKYVRTLS